MKIPHSVRIAGLVLATTLFYGYVGQLVPQKEVQPPQATTLTGDISPAEMAKIGRQILDAPHQGAQTHRRIPIRTEAKHTFG